MALVLSSIVVILVSGVFLVQNEYYAAQISRAQAHDNVRMVTELLSSELRSVMEDGIVVAENKRLVVRSPMLVGVVCAVQGGNQSYVHMEGGRENVDSLEMGGFARWDGAGGWTYYSTTWNAIKQNGSAAGRCEQNGADTTGISDEFFRLKGLQSYLGGPPDVGDVIMFYREIEYLFDTSTMDPASVALYRGKYGDDLSEYATGMDSTAGFEYRTGGASYATSVTGGSLGDVDAIRIVAQARKRVAAGGAEDVTYGWSVNIPLRNSS